MLLPKDHGAEIEVADFGSDDRITLIDTHDNVIEDRQLQIKQRRRITVTSDFESRHDLKWNFYLE